MEAVRFRQVDDQNRGDHFYLEEADQCFFLWEYTAGERWDYSETNQLIVNLKKKKGQGGYNYKQPAIRWCAQVLTPAINPKWLKNAVLVPVPPSKAKADPMYDDRMLRVCKLVDADPPVDVRELIYQTESTEAAHEGNRLKPDALKAIYKIDDEACEHLPKNIAIVDDMLTAGAHFRAMKDILKERLPDTNVVGFFITRRIFSNPFSKVSIDDLLK